MKNNKEIDIDQGDGTKESRLKYYIFGVFALVIILITGYFFIYKNVLAYVNDPVKKYKEQIEICEGKNNETEMPYAPSNDTWSQGDMMWGEYEIITLSEQEECFWNLARESKNEYFCDKITTINSEKERCLLEIVGLNGNVKICDRIAKTNKDLCFKDNQKTYDGRLKFCSIHGCLTNIALYRKDFYYCAKIPEGHSQSCYEKVAEAINSLDFCDSVKDKEKRRYCYLGAFGIDKSDLSELDRERIKAKDKPSSDACFSITKTEQRDWCYLEKGKKEKSQSACKLIENAEKRLDCNLLLYPYDKIDFDTNLCELKKSPNSKDDCYFKVANFKEDLATCELIKDKEKKSDCRAGSLSPTQSFELVVSINRNEKEILNEMYSKDENNVYCKKNLVYFIIPNADPETFKLLENDTTGNYAMDKNNVYFQDWVIENADPESFKIIERYFSRDKDNLFYQDFFYPIDFVSNPENLKALPEERYAIPGVYHPTYYMTDGNKVYYLKESLGEVEEITLEVMEEADAKSFQTVIEREYENARTGVKRHSYVFIDKNNVYTTYGEIKEGAKPSDYIENLE